MTAQDRDDPAIAAAFLDRYLRDADAGAVRTLSEYQAEFPSHRDLVAREFAALQAPPDPSGEGSSQRIAHYQIVEELGRGGQGVVYRALDLRLKRHVALKVLDRLGLRSDAMLARFRREAEVASRLDHPGICTVLDSGVADGVTYIAMQLVQGESLAHRIAHSEPPRGREAMAEVLELFEKAAAALHAAHEAGIVHRDIKPANIMITEGGDPVLLDFGLARDESEEGTHLTQTGDVFGTPAYMSPEQLRGEASRVDRRTDIYSLGAALFECLTHRAPIDAPNREQLYRAILEQEPANPQSLNPALSYDISVVARTALEKVPDSRYQTARAMADDLARVRRYEPIRARPVSAWVRVQRWVQRNRTVAALSAVLFLVLSVSLGVIYTQNLELERELDDAIAGRLTKQEQKVQGLLVEGYQTLFGAESRGADVIFEEILAIDPNNTAAIAGRYWFDIYEPEKATAVLDRYAGGMADDSDVLWMRGLVAEQAGDSERAQDYYAQAGSGETHLRAYLQGLREVKSFTSRNVEDAKRAIPRFRQAIMRSARPQFHYFHSLLMAAVYAGDEPTKLEAAEMLEHHWPDSPGTLDAIAQFFLPTDPDRAERALHRLAEIKPSPFVTIGLAQLELQRGNRDGALRRYEQGLADNPGFALVWFMRGQLWEQHGEPEKARADYSEAVRLFEAETVDSEQRRQMLAMAKAGLERVQD